MANMETDKLELHQGADSLESVKLLGDEAVCLQLKSTVSIQKMEVETSERNKIESEMNSMELRPQENDNVQLILVDSDLSSEDEASDEIVEITETDIEKASMNVLVDHGEFPNFYPSGKKHFEEWVLVDVNEKNYKVTENLLQVSSVYSNNDRLCCLIQ